MDTLGDTGHDSNESQDSMWCATANILKEIRWGEGGISIKKGTKHFRGGAKVHIIDYYPGMCDSVVVVGHHRSSGRYIELSMRAKHLENFRMSTVYSPKVLAVIRERYAKSGGCYSEEYARHICNAARSWAETERNRNRLAKGRRAAESTLESDFEMERPTPQLPENPSSPEGSTPS